MAATDALELPVGITEREMARQIARVEAQLSGLATKAPRQFVKANKEIANSFGNMSRQATAQLQNVSFQLQDIIVQVAGGQGLGRALAQQLPQLLGGFGALGAALGVVAGAGFGLAAMFTGAGKEAKTLDDAVKELNASLKTYNDAVEAANTPTAELVEKYGAAAGAAQRLLEQMAQLAKLDAASTLRSTASAITEQFQGLADLIATIDAEQALGLGDSGLVAGAVDQLNTKFGLTVDQARELQAILTDQQTAATPSEVADTMLRMADFMARVNAESNYTHDTLLSVNKTVVDGALAGMEFAEALASAETAAGGVLGAVGQLPGAIDAATASAAALARNLAAAIQAAQSLPGAGFGAPSLGRFGNGEDITRRAGGADLQEQQEFRYNWLRQLEEASKGGGGGRKRSGGRNSGSGRGGSLERPFFENVERDLLQLERQLELIGKTSEEVATMEARWAMLDEAKKRGIAVNDTMNAQIDAQAAKMGDLTAQLEAGELAQQQFEDAVDGIADAMAGALVAGESLRDGLAQVLKGIASDIINSGIRNALMGQFGGGGGIFGSLFGGIFGGGDALTGALRGLGLPARANGGPVAAGRAYMVGERGPEPFVPAVDGRILSVSQAQAAIRGGAASGGARDINVTVTVDRNGNLQAFVDDRAAKAAGIMGAQVGRAQTNLLNQRTGVRARV